MTRALAGLLIAIGLAPPQTQPVPPPVQPRPAQQPVADAGYLAIVSRYRAGDFENAVEALASHADGHSSAYVIRALENADPDITNPYLELFPLAKQHAALALSPVLPAAAVLHLETARHLFQNPDDERGERGVGHLIAAREIVDGKWWGIVPKILPGRVAHYDAVRHDIYLGIIYALQQRQQFELLLPLLERAREQFPQDAEIRLALGTLDELRATAIMTSAAELPTKQNPSVSWRRKQRREYLDKAADHFRDALTLDAALTEARMRLGRVLQQRGKLPEARRELEMAVAAEAEPLSIAHYFASLFLGEVIQAQGDAAGAIAHYQQTVARWPECQSAHLALSHAFSVTRDRQAALRALEPLWRVGPERKCVDPWWQYNDGQSWRMPELVEALRDSVKKDKS